MNNTKKILKKHNISLRTYKGFIAHCVTFGAGFITFNNIYNLPTTQYNVLVTLALAKLNKAEGTSTTSSSSSDSSSTTTSSSSNSSTSSNSSNSSNSSTNSIPRVKEFKNLDRTENLNAA